MSRLLSRLAAEESAAADLLQVADKAFTTRVAAVHAQPFFLWRCFQFKDDLYMETFFMINIDEMK